MRPPSRRWLAIAECQGGSARTEFYPIKTIDVSRIFLTARGNAIDIDRNLQL
jgi:hypothetical protein